MNIPGTSLLVVVSQTLGRGEVSAGDPTGHDRMPTLASPVGTGPHKPTVLCLPEPLSRASPLLLDPCSILEPQYPWVVALQEPGTSRSLQRPAGLPSLCLSHGQPAFHRPLGLVLGAKLICQTLELGPSPRSLPMGCDPCSPSCWTLPVGDGRVSRLPPSTPPTRQSAILWTHHFFPTAFRVAIFLH